MDMDLIIAKLQERGYNAFVHDVVKNSVTKHGVSIMGSSISPCIYVDEIARAKPDFTLDELVEQIICIYEGNKNLNIDLNQIKSATYVLSHVYIALQRASDEQLIKRDCELEELEEYLYIRGFDIELGNWSVKLNKDILCRAEITVDEAWSAAEVNTFADGKTVIQSISEVMNEILGFNDTEIDDNEFIPMYVISNTDKTQGAVHILDKAAINSFAKKHNTDKLIALPSSTHEMILIIPTDNEENDLQRFEDMVAEINATQVSPEERLSNRAYVLHIEAA